MHHGNIDRDTAAGLKELQRRIAKHKLPESSLDKTLKIATWNIREFGNPARPRTRKSLHYIAEILGQFDLIGVVELRDNVTEMAEVLRILGPYWDIVYSDYIEDHGGNRERVGYVFDRRACVFTGLAGNANEPRRQKGIEYLPNKSWWRKPFMASFRAGNFDFVALTSHVRWGKAASKRAIELGMLADYVYARTVKDTAIDRDVIVMGDFNIPKIKSPLYDAVAARGLTMPKALAGITGSNLGRNMRYDQILHNPVYTKSITDKGGVLDFIGDGWGDLYPEARGAFEDSYTYQLSDHLPLWVMIDTDTDAEQLDQILAPARADAERHDRGISP
ncbi:MAG: endonuclease/exonuclease/phosphatase family protein [Rhodospirillales bacterium]